MFTYWKICIGTVIWKGVPLKAIDPVALEEGHVSVRSSLSSASQTSAHFPYLHTVCARIGSVSPIFRQDASSV